MYNLRKFIESKPFITRNQLEVMNKTLRSEAEAEFKCLMNSNDDIILKLDSEDKLNRLLEQNYRKAFNEMENRRESTLKEMVHKISKDFMDIIYKELKDNQFIDLMDLEDLFSTEKEKVFVNFNQIIEEEDKNIIDKYLVEVSP